MAVETISAAHQVATALPAPKTGAVLETAGLSKHFGVFKAVSNVALAIQPGEVRGLIGPNGAGKSTLLHLLAGRHEATAGRVRLAGRDITHMGPRERARLG